MRDATAKPSLIGRAVDWCSDLPLRFMEWTTTFRYGWVLLTVVIFATMAFIILGSIAAGRGIYWR